MAEITNNKRAAPLTMEGIKSWLPLLLIVVSLVAGWVTMGMQIRQIQIDTARLRYEFEIHIVEVNTAKSERNDQYTNIQVELAKLNATLIYIQKEIESIKLAAK